MHQVTATVENPKTKLRFWGWSTSVSMLGAGVLMLVLLSRLDMPTLWQHVATCDMWWVVLSVTLHYATYLVRGRRWQRCLVHVSPDVRWSRWSLLVFFYNFIDNVVPAKLGDIYGAHLARINCGVSRTAAFGSIVYLRMVDTWIVLLLAAYASWRLFATHLPQAVRWSLFLGMLLALAVTGLVLAAMQGHRTLPGWLPVALQQRLQALRHGLWPPRQQWAPITGLTIMVWGLETVSMLALGRAFQVEMGLTEGLFVTTLPLLASAFPLTPAGVGVVDLTLVSCFRFLGIAPAMAAAMTVVNRLFDYWLHIGVGLVIWAGRQVLGLRTWREVPLEGCRDPLHNIVP